jgi:hypothetical protein
MLYLQASQNARTALGIGTEVLAPPGQTDSALGNWMVTIVSIGRRRAYVFMSSRSLLSFPVMIGKNQITIEDMPTLLIYGLTRLMEHMKTPDSQRIRLLNDLKEIALCKATDPSMIGVFRSVASDYDYRVGRAGGLANVDMDDIVFRNNSIPRATLGYRTSFEVSRDLLQGNDRNTE